MKLHELKPAEGSTSARRRVGRGGLRQRQRALGRPWPGKRNG